MRGAASCHYEEYLADAELRRVARMIPADAQSESHICDKHSNRLIGKPPANPLRLRLPLDAPRAKAARQG